MSDYSGYPRKIIIFIMIREKLIAENEGLNFQEKKKKKINK